MQIAVIPLQLIGLQQLPLLSACPEKWRRLQYCHSRAKQPMVIVPSPLPWVPVATAFLTPAVTPGSSCWQSQRMRWDLALVARKGWVCGAGSQDDDYMLAENRLGLQDPTTASYRLQLIEDSVVFAHVAMGTLKLLSPPLSCFAPMGAHPYPLLSHNITVLEQRHAKPNRGNGSCGQSHFLISELVKSGGTQQHVGTQLRRFVAVPNTTRAAVMAFPRPQGWER